MRKKDKLFMLLLVVTFVITAGMFYYQNFYLEQKAEENKVTVLVAKKDIPEGTLFTTENVGAIKMDKEFVLPNYITSFEELQGKKANSDLLQNELITKGRVDQNTGGSKLFSVSVKGEFNSTIAKGDAIRVYVQKENGEVLELFNKKEVQQVNFKKNASGKETSTIESLDVLMSDKEAIDYFHAQKEGTILVVKYNDLTENNQTAVNKFESQGNHVSDAKLADEQDSEAESETVVYTVESGDTWDTVAEKLGTTAGELKKQNPGLVTLTPGDQIQFVKQ